MAHASMTGVFEQGAGPGLDWNTQETFRLLSNRPGTAYQESDEINQRIFRDWTRKLLQQGPITVTFVKADGNIRDMRCTLSYEMIPESKHPSTVTSESTRSRKPESPDAVHSIRVFDLDIEEWRSFRFDRLKKISAEIAV